MDLELMNEGVVAIIGHFTSTASVAAAPVMEKKGILLISPGATTSKLSKKDDLFLRTIEAVAALSKPERVLEAGMVTTIPFL